jgi:purine-binding chemotaxis protein CheW
VITGLSGQAAAGARVGPALVCQVGERSLAVPMSRVGETMRPLPVDDFPGTEPYVLGVAMIRGEAVPVLDVGVLLGAPSRQPTRFVTVRHENRTLAFAVDAVLGVRSLSEDDLRPLPALLGAVPQSTVRSIAMLDTGLLLVLADARLLPDSSWPAPARAAAVPGRGRVNAP